MATTYTTKRRNGPRPATAGKVPPPNSDKLRGAFKGFRDGFKAWQARRGFVSPKRGFNAMDYRNRETKGDA